MTRSRCDSFFPTQISVSAKKLLRRSRCPLPLKQIHEMVISELGETLDYQQFLHALRTSAKNGAPRFIIDGEVIALANGTLGRSECRAPPESCSWQLDSCEPAVQEQISRRTKTLLCSFGGAMQLDDIEEHLRANGCLWSREQLITSLQSSAKNGVPRYVFHGEVVQLAKGLSWRQEQKEASKQLSTFLQQVDFCSCPWNIALDLPSFKGNSELLKQVVHDQSHADGRPRFEVRKLRGSEWVVATESPKRYNCQEKLRQQAFEAIRALDTEVQSRPSKLLEESKDTADISRLGQLMRDWISGASWLTCFDHSTLVDEVPGIMTRVHLFDGTGIEVRLHMFMDPTETYIHNHRSNFFSYCLSGSYWHKIWGSDESSQGEGERYFVVNRTRDPLFEQPFEKPGSLSVIAAHTHQERGSYYIRSVTPHTVQPQMEGDRATPVLTIYIKDKAAGPDTLVRVAKMQELTSLREQQQQVQDCPLQGHEKLERLRAMHHLTRHADKLRKRPPLRV